MPISATLYQVPTEPRAANTLLVIRAVGDRKFFGMQDSDFAQILPKFCPKKFARGCGRTPAPTVLLMVF